MSTRVVLGCGVALALLAGCGGSRPQTTTAAAPHAVTVTRGEGQSRSGAGASRRPRRVHRAAEPRFTYRASVLSDAQSALMTGRSWHPGCPIGLDELRDVRIGYWDFEARPRVGEMIVNASAVVPLRAAFEALFKAHFPIRRMVPVDAYGGSDYASIEADNTSSFNCRETTGATTWSQHAYGLAIDIDPIENPYVYANGTTSHAASRPYLNRGDVRPGMAVTGGTLVRAFDAIGWGWGGRWPLPTDYQHFSANGR